jgi:hypothetical protein
MSRAATGRGRADVPDRPLIDTRGLSRGLQRYFTLSEAPLTALLFLAPMLVLYEVGTYFYASDWARHTETRVLAFNYVAQFMQWFGATGKYLPAFAVAAVLLAWHAFRGDPWRLEGSTACWMAAECALLAAPLLALSNLIAHYVPLAAAPPVDPGLMLRSGIVLALGAGIYEELVFRLFAFSAMNVILADLLRIGRKPACLLIVFSSAVLFSAYHYWSPQSPPFRWPDAIFRTAAGIYFGGLFLARGFGITAGTHAAYDILFFLLHALGDQ